MSLNTDRRVPVRMPACGHCHNSRESHRVVYVHRSCLVLLDAGLAYSRVNQIGSRLDTALLRNLPRDVRGGIPTRAIVQQSA